MVGTPDHGDAAVGGVRVDWQHSYEHVWRNSRTNLELCLHWSVDINEEFLQITGEVPVLVLDLAVGGVEDDIKHEVSGPVVDTGVGAGGDGLI